MDSGTPLQSEFIGIHAERGCSQRVDQKIPKLYCGPSAAGNTHPNNMITNINKAIENLYDVFSSYECPTEMCGGDGIINSQTDYDRILSTPLRQLTSKQLFDYAGSALYTMGTEEDFRYYLPRLLELFWTDETLHISPAHILTRLPYGNWHEWPQQEQTAIRNFIDTLWETALTQPIDPGRVNEYLAGICQITQDMSPYLSRWRNLCQTSDAARLHLIDFCCSYILDPDDQQTFLLDCFWEDYPDRIRQVLDWAASAPIADILLKSFK